MLQLSDLHCHALGPVDLRLRASEITGLSGPSGSGKTALLRAIADLDQHDGQVLLNNRPQASMPANEWRQQVALLPAKPAWWFEHVGEHSEGFAAETLRQLGFDQRILDHETSRLSTGESQRLALLRLLALRPQVLLLDEPTAGLDPRLTLAVERLIRQYIEDRPATVLWVSHDPAQLKRLAAHHFTIRNRRLTPLAADTPNAADGP